MITKVSSHVGEKPLAIPDAAMGEFEEKYDSHENNRWDLADWLAAFCLENSHYRGSREKYLRMFAGASGASYRELDTLERTARYWPPELREPYTYQGTRIKFSHYETAGEDRELLHWAWENEKSVSQMEARKKEMEQGIPAFQIFLNIVVGSMRKLVSNIPEELLPDAKVLMSALEDLQEKAKGLSDE